jgi:hypothetical protein
MISMENTRDMLDTYIKDPCQREFPIPPRRLMTTSATTTRHPNNACSKSSLGSDYTSYVSASGVISNPRCTKRNSKSTSTFAFVISLGFEKQYVGAGVDWKVGIGQDVDWVLCEFGFLRILN